MSRLDDAPLSLPSYREQSPQVARYHAQLRARPTVLELCGVGKRFPGVGAQAVALEPVTLHVRRGEFVCVVGPSGCGKSTLVRMIAGLDEPTSGTIVLDGVEVDGPSAERGVVFQRYTLFPWLTVLENVMFGPRMRGRPRAEARSQAEALVQMVGLTAFLHRYPHQLSGGMMQRVAIARALANEPRILLMDEPFGALDAQTRATMQGHLLRIWRSVGLTILLVTHDLDEAIHLADRVVVLGPRGRLLEVLEVPVPRPRTHPLRLTGPFLAARRRLEQLIRRSAAGLEHPSA